MFGKKDPVAQELLTEIRSLKREVAELSGEAEANREAIKLSKDIVALRERLSTKQIDWDREKEKWDREKREVEHMVGLQRKRAEQERELAVKEAKLEVREGNLSAKEEAFEERLEHVTQQMKEQIEYLRSDIIKAILDRLPTFDVKTVLNSARALPVGNGNGHGGDED